MLCRAVLVPPACPCWPLPITRFCCCFCHWQGRTLTTAWVGDSRMVLGHQKRGWRAGWEAQDVSVDHKPTDVAERQRILGSHGRVER